MPGHLSSWDEAHLPEKSHGYALTSSTKGVISMSTSRVMAVTAVLGEPSTFVLESNDGSRLVAVSSSLLIQRLLLSAFLTQADVAIDLVPGSLVIKRINAFEAGKGLNFFPENEYYVARCATQRNLGVKDEHLEVFLVRGKDPEKAYNIYDPSLQQVFEAAFGRPGPATKVRLNVEFEGEQITTVRIGEAPGGMSPASNQPSDNS